MGGRMPTGGNERGGLFFPRMTVERKPVNQNDGLPASQILIIKFDIGGIFFSDFYKWHLI
jgi:hypothetical protein